MTSTRAHTRSRFLSRSNRSGCCCACLTARPVAAATAERRRHGARGRPARHEGPILRQGHGHERGAAPARTSHDSHHRTSAACPSAQMQRQPASGLHPRNAAARGRGLKAGMIVAFPSAPGARISSFSPASHLRSSAVGPDRDGPGQRALGAHHGAARPRSLHELLRPDLRVSPRAAPARAEGSADPERRRAQRDRVRRPGHVDLVPEPVATAATSPRSSPRPMPPGSTTLFIKSSDGSTQLLEPVLHPARCRNCTPTA